MMPEATAPTAEVTCWPTEATSWATDVATGATWLTATDATAVAPAVATINQRDTSESYYQNRNF